VSPATRDLAVLSWSWDDARRAGLRRLYRDLLRLRRESPTLRDFGHARVRLLGEAGDVLEVIRGGGGLSPELRITFNLGGEERPLPADLAAEPPAFRSELPEYGAEGVRGGSAVPAPPPPRVPDLRPALRVVIRGHSAPRWRRIRSGKLGREPAAGQHGVAAGRPGGGQGGGVDVRAEGDEGSAGGELLVGQQGGGG
jgi:hypothetical protein